MYRFSKKDFQNSSPFETSACFYVTINESFKRFLEKIFSAFERSACFYVAIGESFKRFLETNFLENENLFQKTGVPLFS